MGMAVVQSVAIALDATKRTQKLRLNLIIRPDPSIVTHMINKDGGARQEELRSEWFQSINEVDKFLGLVDGIVMSFTCV